MRTTAIILALALLSSAALAEDAAPPAAPVESRPPTPPPTIPPRPTAPRLDPNATVALTPAELTRLIAAEVAAAKAEAAAADAQPVLRKVQGAFTMKPPAAE